MIYKIDTEPKPIAPKVRPGPKPKYPWWDLNIGDSFVVKDKPFHLMNLTVHGRNKALKRGGYTEQYIADRDAEFPQAARIKRIA